MTGFFALLRLQLLSRFADLKPQNLKKAFQEKRARSVGTMIAVIILVLYLGGMLFFLETKALDVLMSFQVPMPDLLVTMAIMLAMLGTLVISFFFIMSTLYLGRDAAFLASMPLRTRTILSAKLAQVWVSETLISAVLVLPACILFGIRTGQGFAFYLRLIPVWLLVDVLPICIVTFVSTLLIRVSALWKHREILTTVFGIGFLVIYMFVMANLGGITGDTGSGGDMLMQFFTNYATRISGLTQIFPPAGWAAKGLLGDYGQLALYIGVCVAAAALTIWLVGFIYRKLSLLQAEAPSGSGRKANRKESFGRASAFKACALRELRVILRVPSYATNILPMAFMPVLMVIIMGVMVGRNLEGGGLQQMLNSLDETLLTAIMFGVMAYMGGMNTALATAVTREGKGHAMMTSLPVPARTIIRSKFAVGYGLSVIGIIGAGIALAVIVRAAVLPIVLACVLCLLFSYVMSCASLIRDIKKPRLDWVTEQEAVKQNFGVLITMLVSWGILIALAGLSYLFITNHFPVLAYAGVIGGLLAVAAAVATSRLMKTADRYYWQG